MRARILEDPDSRSDVPVRRRIVDCGLGLLDQRAGLQALWLLRRGRIALQLDQPAVQTHHHDEGVLRIGLWIRRLGMKI